MKRRMLYAYVLMALVVLVMLSACAATAPRPLPPQPANPEAQQQYYDLGLKYYTEEKYDEAKSAFHLAIENGPGTFLGSKAFENLKKTEQVLKTLKELEQK